MSTVTLRSVPTDQLVANRRNVREALEDIPELAASIRANGLLQPIIVNDQGGRLVVTDGHRRLEAARLAGVPTVMCLVTTGASVRRVTTTMLAAAMHKELRPLEQARAFKALQDEGVIVAEIARSTGYSQALIRGRLLLLELPAEAQDMVEDDELTIGQATELAKQVRSRKSGGVAQVGSGKETGRYWQGHPLRGVVNDFCTHRDIRRTLGGRIGGCAPCWEQVIRADERERMAEEAAS
ncbi:ParB/RepB/Spo0J family partition protein [Terrabacter terrigena]|uniref:ParB/RepB/Spo0J family partition protein n=1 Tax=Terrabacter terrigena TaxID=574718 RepID=A0ABW3MXY6_9MICO